MSNVAIRVNRLAKQYRIGKRERYRTLRDTITDALTAPLRKARSLAARQPATGDKASDLFWALDDVSFEVSRGEVVGIVGRNGAGKSTLLKVLSRITEPTRGRLEIHGRVGSLLEVGTGFHPELTGRDNIFLNGAILGMRKAEVTTKFDEIVAFAEVDRFIDTPVKHYSSGMYMRLAFAVAAHLEPEVLLVDEVLAVGDAKFQKKCLGKIDQVARHGRTVLFVSHNMVAVQNLCNHAIWLSSGRLVDYGDTGSIVTKYLSEDAGVEALAQWPDSTTAPGDDTARIESVQVRPLRAGATPGHVPLDSPIDVEVTYRNYVPDALLNVSLHVYNAEQVCVFNAISPPTLRAAGLIREVCEIPGEFLNTGLYRIGVLVVRDTASIHINLPDVVSFETVEAQRSITWYGRWAGVVRPNLTWRSRQLSTAAFTESTLVS